MICDSDFAALVTRYTELLAAKLEASYGKPLSAEELADIGSNVAHISVSQDQFRMIPGECLQHRWSPAKQYAGFEFWVSPYAEGVTSAEKLLGRTAYNLTKYTRKFFPALT